MTPCNLTTLPLATALHLVAEWFDLADNAQAAGRDLPPLPFTADSAWLRCTIAADVVATLDGMPSPARPRLKPERTPHV